QPSTTCWRCRSAMTSSAARERSCCIVDLREVFGVQALAAGERKLCAAPGEPEHRIAATQRRRIAPLRMAPLHHTHPAVIVRASGSGHEVVAIGHAPLVRQSERVAGEVALLGRHYLTSFGAEGRWRHAFTRCA